MRPFVCPVCRAMLSFEDLVCLTCHTELAYDRATARLVAAGDTDARCINRAEIDCNWAADHGLCGSCLLTRTRPSQFDDAAVAAWAMAEIAKRRLLYELDGLGLDAGGVRFDLLSSQVEPVTTGHADGVITVDLAEGSDVHRESVRIGLGESYRTMLGHLRHEIGHFFWQQLVDGSPALTPFRDLFGDDRIDYAGALQEHYGHPDDGDWRADFVSRYAASHPWEDWAESFAHYLLIRDVIQTAAGWRVTIGGPLTTPPVTDVERLAATPEDVPADFDALIATWLPLSYALNAVNRSLGQDDAYPFVLTSAALSKVRFVHDIVGRAFTTESVAVSA